MLHNKCCEIYPKSFHLLIHQNTNRILWTVARPFVAFSDEKRRITEVSLLDYILLIRLPETFINPNIFIEYLQHLYSYIETLSPNPRAWLKWNRLKVSVKVSRSDCDVRCYSSRHSDGSIIAIAIISERGKMYFYPQLAIKYFVSICVFGYFVLHWWN